MKAVIRPRAQDDILWQFRWYLVEQDAPDVAFRFVEAVEVSVEQLVACPVLGINRTENLSTTQHQPTSSVSRRL